MLNNVIKLISGFYKNCFLCTSKFHLAKLFYFFIFLNVLRYFKCFGFNNHRNYAKFYTKE